MQRLQEETGNDISIKLVSRVLPDEIVIAVGVRDSRFVIFPHSKHHRGDDLFMIGLEDEGKVR